MASSTPAASTDVATVFTHHQIVPDVVPTPPTLPLVLTYSDGSAVALGNEQLISSTQSPPSISFPNQSATVHYSLLMIDPDNDSRETHKFRQFIHWFVVNIPGVAGGQGLAVDKGFVVSPYMGCAPDPGSGRHRYVFLLYQQQGVIATENVKVLGEPRLLGLMANLDERKNHDIAKWFATNGGQQPQLLAGNFFFAEKTA